jgi:hypothetical protein
MAHRLLQSTLAVVLAATCGMAVAQSPDVSGFLGVEPRVFVDEPAFPEQPGAGLSPSAVVAPELRADWNDGDDQLTVSLFARYDGDDDNRTHWDVREAYWRRNLGDWTMLVGVNRVFWGVTESRHLVDIVNQTDLVEDIDEEDKLGQPMISLEHWGPETGSITVYVMPGFRERTFPARDARLRGPLPVDTDNAEYESSAGNGRVDWALRWSQTRGNWDLGWSGFYGTGREPLFVPRTDVNGNAVLVPRYEVIGQLGADIQYTTDAWLWKLEAIGRHGHGSPFAAIVAGFEFTVFGLRGTSADLGLLAEYLYDGRDDSAPPTYYDAAWFGGARWSLNDTQDTTVLAGAIINDAGSIAILEAARRLGSSWKLAVEARLFLDVDVQDPYLAGYRNDSYVTLSIARYL